MKTFSIVFIFLCFLCFSNGSLRKSKVKVLKKSYESSYERNSISISCSTNSIDKSGDKMIIKYNGIKFNKEENYFLGAYLNGYTETRIPLIKYEALSEGEGEIEWSMTNLRSNYTISAFRGSLDNNVEVGRCEDPITFQSFSEPTGVHLALTGREGEMRVSWTASSTLIGCSKEDVKGVVGGRIREEGGEWEEVKLDSMKTYTKVIYC